jgi:hypothetical protein
MKQSVWILMVPLLLALSCSTGQPAVPEEPAPQTPPPLVERAPAPLPVAAQIPEEEPNEEESFDPENVSEEDDVSTIQDIREMVLNLNNIVREKDFTAWMSYLADSSIEMINSREFLDERANDLHKKNVTAAAVRGQDISRLRKINFRGPQDYFNYVVVPSHANDHVDEITFSSQTQVTAYIRDEKGQRLILYDLKKIDGFWKIIIVS